MIRRSTWIMLLVFALAVAGMLLWQRAGIEPAATATLTVQPNVFPFAADAINKIHLENASLVVDYERQTDGSWLMLGEPAVTADGSVISQRLGNLAGARVLNTLSAPPADSITGLDQPLVAMSVTLDDGKTFRLEAGAATPTGSGYYTRVDGSQVVVINKATVDGILGLLQSPPLVTPEPIPTESTPQPAATESTPAP